MIKSTEAYKAAITADARRTLLKAVIEIIDPDMVLGTPTHSAAAPFAKPEQIADKEMESVWNYATLERNRWTLGGNIALVPEDNNIPGQVGFVSEALSGDNCYFAQPPWVELPFANVSILQAFSVYFPNNDADGYPVDFTVEVKSGGKAFYTQEVKGNTASYAAFTGFTVNYPDAIRITVQKWSAPSRRMRIPEVLPGIYEEWNNDILASFDAVQQGDVSCISLRYGTVTLKMDNLDRRFEPRNKAGIFKSIEERQGIDISVGVRLADGTDEYRQIGRYYQYSNGWKTGDNGITMQWNLVDIVGLLSNREFIPPATLPTTLDGWMAALVAQLGENFTGLYHVDPAYASKSVTATDRAHVTGKKCGDILRFVCMASGTWPRADSETGYLTAEPLWSEGNKLTLDNMVSYPVMRANNDIGALVFKLYDGKDTQYVVSGTAAASSSTASIDNPFIHSAEQALTAARNILATYGGNQLETVGRGDPASEIGDVDTVWLDESSATTGRRIYQTFTIKDGVLRDCKSTLLQADGSFLYENMEVITESGTWTAPANAKQLRLIIGGGGQSGTDGTDGTWDAAGVAGIDGAGGKVWHGTIDVNGGQSFNVNIGGAGEASVFGQHSSEDGHVYPYGFTDVASGNSYARTGVELPAANSGDGGAGGRPGNRGVTHQVRVEIENEEDPEAPPEYYYQTVIDVYPGKGMNGKAGASGFVVVYWDKEGT